jgi:hypothetical protein
MSGQQNHRFAARDCNGTQPGRSCGPKSDCKSYRRVAHQAHEAVDPGVAPRGLLWAVQRRAFARPRPFLIPMRPRYPPAFL